MDSISGAAQHAGVKHEAHEAEDAYMNKKLLVVQPLYRIKTLQLALF